MILAFYNLNNISKFNYLSETLRDGLRSRLQAKDKFNFISFDQIQEKSKGLKFSSKELIIEKNAVKIAKSLNADFVVINKFFVINNQIMLYSVVYDLSSEQGFASSIFQGNTGINIFTLIEKISDDIFDYTNHI